MRTFLRKKSETPLPHGEGRWKEGSTHAEGVPTPSRQMEKGGNRRKERPTLPLAKSVTGLQPEPCTWHSMEHFPERPQPDGEYP